ncbi:MAG: hypothetical protein AAF984_04830 [Verrucomicrobiota bacterium]
MKCILHIGTEKTATTTIQEFLHLNRRKLLQMGYLYTKSAGLRHNCWLTMSAYEVSRRNNQTRHRGIYTDEKLLNYQARIIRDLKREVDNAKPFQVVVFSSEHIQSHLTKSSELSRLKTRLNQLGFEDIDILVYLRRPVDIASSLYSTGIKSGSRAISPPSPKSDNYYRNICDHQSTLIRFRDVFGDAAIKPRLFDPKEFKNGNVISDFLDAIGLSHVEKSFEFPSRQNESLSAVGLELLRQVNQQIPMFIDERPNLLRINLVHYFEKHFKMGSGYRMPEELFWHYESEFEEGNEWVRKKYFPERGCLFSKPTYPDATESIFRKDELESMAKMIANMWLDKQRMPSSRVERAIYYIKQWAKTTLFT